MDLPEIKEGLVIRPGDHLVVAIARNITVTQTEAIKTALKESFTSSQIDNVQVTVIGVDGVALAKITPEADQPAPWKHDTRPAQ